MVALYIILGIILLICLLLLVKARVVISYEDSLRVYLKILFVKINLIPPPEKKKKKPKKKKRAKKKKGEPSPAPAPAAPQSEKKEKNALSKLFELREILLSTIARFFGKLRFKFIRLKIVIGCDNAATTALAYAGVNQAVAYIIEILKNISNVDVAKNADISVDADFISQKSSFEGKIMLHITVAQIASVALHFLIRFFKSKTNTED